MVRVGLRDFFHPTQKFRWIGWVTQPNPKIFTTESNPILYFRIGDTIDVYVVRVGLGWVERFFLSNSKVWVGWIDNQPNPKIFIIEPNPTRKWLEIQSIKYIKSLQTNANRSIIIHIKK